MDKELKANTTLSHYRIVSKLGEGGMGEVYLAQDTQLDRKVALKVLPADLASNEDRMRRFKQEAKSAATLNHPNIAHIYEIGEADGVNFIAMEFIEGVTLRDKIHRERVELRRLLRYLQHAAEGLAKAHAVGIVHRDLKPDNIMITQEGHAKILDFGLAKLIEGQGDTETRRHGDAEPASDGDEGQTLIAASPRHPVPPSSPLPVATSPGLIMGTVGYMSPEQAQGKTKEIDQRSDIFSFGCILFEGATGKKPFEGDSIIKSLHSLIYEPAPQIKDLNPAAPAELQRIIRRCLAKDKDERYQSIKEVAIELKELRRELESAGDLDTTVPPPSHGQAPVTTVSGSTIQPTDAGAIPPTASSAEFIYSRMRQHRFAAAIVALVLLVGVAVVLGFYLRSGPKETAIDSIAVLPFQNKSSDADTEYLSDGLSESLIYRLSQLPNLKVSPTSSVFRYKGKDTDVAQIAKELEVDAVMSGRVSQRGDDLTISVELVDARTKKIIWAEQYDRRMSDLLATQREIATTITQKLELKLSGDAKGITKRYTDSNEAYQLYLRGRYSFAKRTKEGHLRAIEYFGQAIKLDPKFALAYARISEVYGSMPAYPYLSPKEAFPQAKSAAQQALAIDPTLAEAHTFLAYSLVIYDWNWVEAERSFKRAIELDPNNSAAHFRYGQIFLAPTGRIDEALAEIKRGLDLEPLDINMGGTFAWAYFVAGQNDKGMEQARKTYDLDPVHPIGRWMLSQANINEEMYAEAISLNEQWLQTDPANQFALRDAGIAYAKAGRRDKAEEMINRFREIAKTQYIATCRIASIYVALGDRDKAFEELRKAFEMRDWELFRLTADQYWNPIRDDPRYKEIVKRLNLPQ